MMASQFKLSLRGPLDLIDEAVLFLGELCATPPDALAHFELRTGYWQADAYCEDHGCGSARIAVLKDELLSFLGDGAQGLAITSELVGDENWVARAQQGLPPVHAGGFIIHGSHDRHRLARRRGAIEIDAGEAFGTAHHGTTVGCLVALERILRTRRPRRVLDLGTGSGVLAIAAARRLPDAEIVATDIDATSIRVARRNCDINEVGSRIRLICAAGFDTPQLRGARPFDLVTANILAGPLKSLAPDFARAVAPGAALILSGLLVSQRPSVQARFRAQGFVHRHCYERDGWATLVLEQPSSR